MNYTYLPTSPYSARPVIVMTTNPASRKTTNIVANPNVSLLVHDCPPPAPPPRAMPADRAPGVSHRPPTHGRRPSGGSPDSEHRSSLASLLLNLNTSAMSSISATIAGAARLAPTGSDEEKFYTERHLDNNTFDDGAAEPLFRPQSGAGAGGHFVAGEEVRVIVVDIRDVRVSDWKGTVRDWAYVSDADLVNGAG